MKSQLCFIQFDRDDEIVLMIDAHWQLRFTIKKNISFVQCYFYETSTANQRIES